MEVIEFTDKPWNDVRQTAAIEAKSARYEGTYLCSCGKRHAQRERSASQTITESEAITALKERDIWPRK